jgi:hypothetical protein
MKTQQHDHHHTSSKECFSGVPEFERLSYFYGQLLGVQDFRTEQSYFREKLRLHNRCLHGYGVVCGLHLSPVPVEKDCLPEDLDKWRELCKDLEKLDEAIPEEKDPDRRAALEALRERLRRRKECDSPPGHIDPLPALVRLSSGLAIDCEGNEIIVREPIEFDLRKALGGAAKHHRPEKGETKNVWVLICYCEQPSQRSRAVLPDSCGSLSECNYGRYRDSFRLRVTFEEPAQDKRCDVCCECCEDECVLLARIRWTVGRPILEEDIHCGVRRPIGLYRPTVITGISWRHGASYTPRQAIKLLGTDDVGPRTDGLEIRLSRPVLTETIQPGVIDLWRVQGGAGLRGVISNIEGSYHNLAGPTTDRIFFRDESGESLNRGDRVLITVRCNFILDECCRPIDGDHIGGRVPLIDTYEKDSPPAPAHHTCRVPPGGCGPWTSGNGNAGGTFESWFYVGDPKEGTYKS